MMRFAAVPLLLCGGWCCQLARAEADPSAAPLARVGSLAIEASALSARAQHLLPEQRARLGQDWPEQRRRLLAEELVPGALLQLEAARVDRGIFSARDRALAAALGAELQREALARGVSPEQLARRRAAQERHDALPAILIWRILVRSEADALALLKELGQPSESSWSRLARERSIDRATHMRSGSLGYVAASGQTHMPQVRVSPALFAAAAQVQDGQLVPRPVPEGTDFAVVWRRASRLAPARGAEPARVGAPGAASAAAAELGAQLVSEAAAKEARALVQRLRAERLREHQPELVAGLELRSTATQDGTAPGRMPPLEARPVTLTPRPTDSGLR